jgi:hypothetical protein
MYVAAEKSAIKTYVCTEMRSIHRSREALVCQRVPELPSHRRSFLRRDRERCDYCMIVVPVFRGNRRSDFDISRSMGSPNGALT